jgi:predicted translin family RNA/ssDNA-binding protein
MKKIIYIIKKKDIEDVKDNMKNIEKHLKEMKKPNRTVVRIYTAILGNEKYVAYTTQTLSFMIKNQIYNNLKGISVSFTDEFKKSIGVKIELNELYSTRLTKNFYKKEKICTKIKIPH